MVQGQAAVGAIALTVVGAGETHPPVAHLSGTVADAVVSFDNDLQVTLTADNILYDGQSYNFPDAIVTFDPGANGTISSGNAVQTVAYGSAAVAPELNVASGSIFNGWDKTFVPVLTDMTVTANYLAIESIPTAPDHLVASAVSAIEIGLTWSDNSIGETGFVIERRFDATNWALLANVAAEITTYSDNSLSPDTTAYYRIKATGTGGDSAWSATASATTLAPNSSPSFDSLPNLLAHEGIAYFSTIRASDPEDDSLTFTAINLPAWLELIDFGDGSADLVGTPDASETGDQSVTIEVSDGISAPVETTFTISVNARPVDTLDSPTMNPVSLPEDVGLMLQVTVTDGTASTVEWSQVNGPGALAFATPNGLINGVTATANGEGVGILFRGACVEREGTEEK
jgi:Tfp pilus assembly protein PilX